MDRRAITEVIKELQQATDLLRGVSGVGSLESALDGFPFPTFLKCWPTGRVFFNEHHRGHYGLSPSHAGRTDKEIVPHDWEWLREQDRVVIEARAPQIVEPLDGRSTVLKMPYREESGVFVFGMTLNTVSDDGQDGPLHMIRRLRK